MLLHLEELESRAMLSATSATVVPSTGAVSSSSTTVQPLLTVVPEKAPSNPSATPAISGYTPQQIQQAYGVSAISPVNGKSINGAGETIAIVDAYYDPNIVSDVKTFNSQFGLQQFNVSNGPTLNVVASGGGLASSLAQDSTGGWALETSLDVEWAHAMAPQANILLVEAPNQNLSGSGSLLDAVQYAASQTGVVAVSMSWGQNEFSGESSYDSYFVPPSNNPGVTFVAASGDNGASYGPIYPATSPYVLAVGGTTLTTTTTSSGATAYGSESAWSGSGGGAAAYEGEPSYQSNQASIGSPDVSVYNWLTGTYSSYSSRLTPDVSYNADPNTGYAIYDSVASSAYGFSGGWTEVGGTSAGAPQWSAIVALSDQQRVAQGGTALDTNQVQNTLYNTLSNSTTYAHVFHDITTGSNGYSAGPGYDVATGLGTPIVNNIVPLLAKTTIPLGQLPTIQGSGYGSGATSASFGSSTFSSFARSSASTVPGGGLYNSVGSISIGAASGPAGGVSGHAAAPALPVLPLTSTVIATPADNPTAAPTIATTNLFGPINTAPQGSEATPVNTMLTNASNASLGQSNVVFGASGVNGPPDSWRLSSLGLNGPQIEQLAGDLAGFLSEDANDSSEGNDSSPQADESGGDLSALDGAPPVLLETDAGGGDE